MSLAGCSPRAADDADSKPSGAKGPSGAARGACHEARKLDIDHMVPLAEAWDSGAFGWTLERREAYANDLGAERSLVAVTAKSNRSKSDRDPASWLPLAEDAHCLYAADWTGTKLRWQLNADDKEPAALVKLAEACPDTTVQYEAAQ